MTLIKIYYQILFGHPIMTKEFSIC